MNYLVICNLLLRFFITEGAVPTAILATIAPFEVIGGREHQETLNGEIIIRIIKAFYLLFLLVGRHE